MKTSLIALISITVILVGVVVVIALAGGYSTENFTTEGPAYDKNLINKWQACTRDEECTSLGVCTAYTSVNKAYENEMNEYFGKIAGYDPNGPKCEHRPMANYVCHNHVCMNEYTGPTIVD